MTSEAGGSSQNPSPIPSENNNSRVPKNIVPQVQVPESSKNKFAPKDLYPKTEPVPPSTVSNLASIQLQNLAASNALSEKVHQEKYKMISMQSSSKNLLNNPLPTLQYATNQSINANTSQSSNPKSAR